MTQARTVSEILEELDTALSKATDLPWEDCEYDKDHLYIEGAGDALLVFSWLREDDHCIVPYDNAEANAELIVKLVNAYPALREEIERKDVELARLRMERDHLQEAIVKYGRTHAMGFAEPAHLQLAIDNAFQAHARRTLQGDEDNE